jgi:hypothetical protein
MQGICHRGDVRLHHRSELMHCTEIGEGNADDDRQYGYQGKECELGLDSLKHVPSALFWQNAESEGR